MDKTTLKKLFQDRDKSVRLFCLKSILKYDMTDVDELLLEALRDGRPEIVIAAMKASKKSDSEEVIRMIVAYLDSPNGILRHEALYALNHRNYQFVKDALCEFLRKEEDTSLVATAVMTIGNYRSLEFVPLLRAFLEYNDDRVRSNAVEALGYIDGPEITELLKSLVNDSNNRVRANAIKALWERGVRYGLSNIAEELRSPNTRKRASAAYILGEIKEERSLDLLVGLLNDVSPTVRNRAVLSIEKVGSPRVIANLIEAFVREEEPAIRETIVAVALKLSVDIAMARLTEKYTREENSRNRAMIIRCLGIAAIPQTLPLLAMGLRDSDSRVRANAVEAVGLLNDTQAVELLLPLLNDPNNRVRSNAATALWKLGGTGAIVTLKQMIQSSHKQMRSSAAWALGEIGALQFNDVLQDLTADTDPDVRRCALKALAKVTKIS